MTRDEETRLWIKTHLRQIERPEEVEDYLLAYRYLDSRRDEITKEAEIEVHGGVGWLRRGTSVIAVPDDWHDGAKVTVRISKINDNDNENRLKMKALQHITFTGVDEKTDIKTLLEIQKAYPFVEFGVLVAKNWKENGNRYPDPDTLSRLANKGLNLSCHVCGSYARAITQDIEWSLLFDLLGENKDIFNRCQINIAANEPTDKTFYLKTPRYFKEIIIQQKSVDEHKTWDAINWHGFMSILLDASGGLGIDTGIKLWPDWFYKVGYAGGMNADNVGDKLAYLIENAHHPFWIDMESGVRTDDWFDLDKVVKVLDECNKVLASYTPEQLHRR